MNDDELKDLFNSLDDAPKKKDSSKGDVKAPSKSSSESEKNDKSVDSKSSSKKTKDEMPSLKELESDSKNSSKTTDDKKKTEPKTLSESKNDKVKTESLKKQVSEEKTKAKETKPQVKEIKSQPKDTKSNVKEVKPLPKQKLVKSNEVKKQEKKASQQKVTSNNEEKKEPLFDFDKAVRKVTDWSTDVAIKYREKKASQENIPWREREYFKNFPLSFKSVLLILLVATLVVAFMCFLFFPQFRVLNYAIEGNITISKQELIEQSGIEPNSHLFSNVSGDLIDIVKCDYGKIEDKMKENNPYIKDIQISASFPSTIKMVVTERNKIAYVKMPDGYAAIDEDGIVIELTTFVNEKESHAVICGLDVSGAVVKEKINIVNDSDYQKAIIVLGAILTADINGANSDEYMMFENTKEIRIIPGGNIFLTITLPSGSELQVKLKDVVNINDDMAILRRAIIMDTFEGLPNGSFDMTGDEYIYRKYD